MSTPCIFFDRDGIINTNPPPEVYYVTRNEHFLLQSDFVEALRLVNRAGLPAIVVTNQKCVAKGLISEQGIHDIHAYMNGLLRERGVQLDDIYFAPHFDEHPDFKPNPGMLLRAAEDHNLDLAASWMVGDRERDIQAAINAGVGHTLLVGDEEDQTQADHHLLSINELPAFMKTILADL